MSRLRGWWERRTERQRAVLRYALPLIAFGIIFGLEWLRLHEAGVTTRAESQRLFLVIGIGIVYSLIIKVVFSRVWPMQEIGHLSLLLGMAGLSLLIFARPGGSQRTPEWQRDVIQAFLDVAAVILPAGMTLWVLFHARRRDGGNESGSSTVVYDRRKGQRRHGFGRRKDDHP